MEPKPFLTIQEQLALLKTRGLDLNEDDLTFDATSVLMKEGYYSLINGYEEPFVGSSDNFKKGASLRDIHSLLLFDRALRKEVFSVAIEAEALLRTAVAYCFGREFGNETSAYLNPKHYNQENMRNVNYIIGRFERILYHRKKDGTLELKTFYRKPYIEHYLKEYNNVPIWVIVNALMLGDTISFYECFGEYLQREVCSYVQEYGNHEGANNSSLTPSSLIRDFYLIRDFRNLCAHDERVYCARSGKSGSLTFVDFFHTMTRYSTLESVVGFFDRFEKLIEELTRNIGEEFSNAAIRKMGANKGKKLGE